MDIRHAGKSDIDALFQLWKEMQLPHSEYHPQYYPLTDEATVEEKTRKHLSSMIGDSDFCFLCAWEGNSIIGYCVACTQEMPPIFKPTIQLHIQQVVVSEAYRRKGVFKKLLNSVTSWGVSRGATGTELVVDTCNPAVEAYKACGFGIVQHKMFRRI